SKPAKKTSINDFNWTKVLEYTKEHLTAIHSVLNKCEVDFDGETLTIHAVRKFNKTKLDEAKYLTQLHEALASIGFDGLTIVTLPTSKLPADAQLAKVAAMMGGGKEVPVDEV
ncbi:MAG: dnaX, partial [Candidatus Saccharibacteria bacterium]|nr:dnaX [Candidatus Saccharibacteria bacterium]